MSIREPTIGSRMMRSLYISFFAASLTLMGGRRTLRSASAAAATAIDAAISCEGDPETRADVTAVGALMPTAAGLAITLPGLLLYPLYEVPVVLTVMLTFMMICTALSLTQLVRHLAAVRDRSRWRTAGRPREWRSSMLARPSGIDIPVWLVLAATLIWATT